MPSKANNFSIIRRFVCQMAHSAGEVNDNMFKVDWILSNTIVDAQLLICLSVVHISVHFFLYCYLSRVL